MKTWRIGVWLRDPSDWVRNADGTIKTWESVAEASAAAVGKWDYAALVPPEWR